MQDAEQGADRQLAAILKPRVKRAPSPRVHADLPAFAALASPDQHGPAGRIKIGLRERECLTDPQTGAPQHHDDQFGLPVESGTNAWQAKSAWRA